MWGGYSGNRDWTSSSVVVDGAVVLSVRRVIILYTDGVAVMMRVLWFLWAGKCVLGWCNTIRLRVEISRSKVLCKLILDIARMIFITSCFGNLVMVRHLTTFRPI
jgi:hypothetical protein